MSKHYDNPDHIIGKSFKRINEDAWFKTQQTLLLWMANTDYGRKLLCIDPNFPKITNFTKNSITGVLDVKKKGKKYLITKKTDVRIGAKWANVIRYRWQEFQAYSQEYYALHKKPVLFPVVPQWNFAYTTSTFYPDPNVETTTVDGRVFRAPAPSEVWATIRAGDGTNSNDSASGADAGTGLDADDAANPSKYTYLGRAFFLFDTSSISDTDSVDSGTFSLYITSKNDALGGGSVRMVTSAPASNTALANGDFTSQGTTAQATDLTISGITTTAYNDWTLNATGLSNITKTGVSKFGTRLARDADDSTPTWATAASENILFYYADQASTTNDPKLVVVHSVVVAVANHPTLLLMNVG